MFCYAPSTYITLITEMGIFYDTKATMQVLLHLVAINDSLWFVGFIFHITNIVKNNGFSKSLFYFYKDVRFTFRYTFWDARNTVFSKPPSIATLGASTFRSCKGFAHIFKRLHCLPVELKILSHP